MVCTQSGILFSHRKWNLAIYDNIGELGGHYGCWNTSHQKTKIACFLIREVTKSGPTDQNRKENGSCLWLGCEELGICCLMGINF